MSYPAQAEGLVNMIIIPHILHRLLLNLITTCVGFSSNVDTVSILLRFWSFLWHLKIFVVSTISLILSLFLNSYRVFVTSLDSSGLFLWYVVTYAWGFTHTKVSSPSYFHLESHLYQG